ncbi:MAG: hypothetical protein IKQ20_11235, partial [Bacteroidales bacterium]|nr:hypothetical protein [Bacteroidales bacterium]
MHRRERFIERIPFCTPYPKRLIVMKLLLTGFEPFGQESVNPSWEAVKAFPDMVEGVEVVKVRLPVTFKGAAV